LTKEEVWHTRLGKNPTATPFPAVVARTTP
jgi:hypothetical protein